MIIVDGSAICDTDMAPSGSVGDAVRLARSTLGGNGRVMMSVICDGDEIDAARLEAVMSRPYRDYQTVELTSGSPFGAALDALNQARAGFGESFALVREVSASLASGDIAAAMNGLSRCVASWADMHEAVVQGGTLVGVDFERLVLGERHVLDWLGELNRRLRDIRDAVDGRDYVMLGDILKYELDETLQGWESMLDAFARHVERMQAGCSSREPATACVEH